MGEVSKRQSPIDRRRMNKIRAFGERRWNRSLVRLVFNFRFADQHHGNVVANRVHAAALSAFQALAAFGEIDRRFAKGTNKYLKKLRIHGHSDEMLPQDPEGIPGTDTEFGYLKNSVLSPEFSQNSTPLLPLRRPHPPSHLQLPCQIDVQELRRSD